MYCNKNNGFTLIEVVVAVVITGMVIVGVLSVIQSTVADHHLAASRLQAAYLAQEKIEEIRNQRDENWLLAQQWTNNIASEIDPLLLGKFRRVTTITLDPLPPGTNEITIEVRVSWEDRRGEHDITVITKLYNWYE